MRRDHRRPPRDPVTSLAALAAPALLLLAACTSNASRPHPADLHGLLASTPPPPVLKFAPLSPEEFELRIPPPGPYRLGKGDVLHVVGPAETFGTFGETKRGDIVGTRIKEDGKVYLPLVGGIEAAGKTALELQEAIRTALSRYQENPFVSVDVIEYRSQRFYVLGEVAKPGVLPVDNRTTLIEAISQSGGFTRGADVEQTVLLRKGQVLPVSAADVLRRGDMRQNAVLEHGDLVFVPQRLERRVYVFGEVAKPSIVPIEDGVIPLAAVIAAAGDINPSTADVNQVRIFRGGWGNPQCYTLSIEEVYRFGNDIQLQPGDRVLVAPTSEATWSRALNLVSPLVNLVLAGTTTALAVEAVNN